VRDMILHRAAGEGDRAQRGGGGGRRTSVGRAFLDPDLDDCDAVAPSTASRSPSPVDGGGIVIVARSWLGTPYRHQASVKGVGADCLGLVRGVWRDVVGGEMEAPPAYSADWAEVGGREMLLEAAERWL